MSQPDTTEHSSYHIRTFGCQMNVHDSEHIAGVLESHGYHKATDIDSADVIIFNTCCVRQSAEDRVWGNLGAVRKGGSRVLAVCGCMAQRHGLGIIERSGGVDLVFGMEALGRLGDLIETARSAPVCDLGVVEEAAIDGLPAVRSSRAQAWVPISHGCDNNCSYCVVPRVRGPERSRSEQDVLEEIGRLAADGVLEVILLGQNVNSYGRDLGAAHSFAKLLEKIAQIDGIKRVKFETSHPGDLSDEVLDVMATCPPVCEYLHLPVQSGSDRILSLMNRRYDRDFYMQTAQRARDKVDGLTLTTDIIVGFPTETEEDFLSTLDLVERVGFDAAYMFIYSHRQGTAAASMRGEVSRQVIGGRFARLADLQARLTAASLARVTGERAEVLIEGPSRRGGLVSGRTRGHRVVLMEHPGPSMPLVEVHIDSAGKHSLRGTILREYD
jgi:tRNA-2-methylthio-N6-dimethylallyladenosine synthase